MLRRLLLKILIVAAPFVALLAAAEIFCRTKTNIAINKAYLEQHAPAIGTLVLGDSHALNAIEPSLLDSCATLALGGQPLSVESMLLQRTIDKLPHLHTVIIEVSPHRFYYDLSLKNWNGYLYRVIYGIPYKTERPSIKNHLLIASGYKHCITLMFRHYFPGSAAVNDNADRFAALGYDSGKIAASFHMPHSFDSAHLLAMNEGYLQKMAALCAKRGVRVVLVSTPLYKTYAWQVPIGVYKDVGRKISGIQAEYSTLYLPHMIDTSFTVRDYRDDDHLNPAGAIKFTRMLKEELKDKQ